MIRLSVVTLFFLFSQIGVGQVVAPDVTLRDPSPDTLIGWFQTNNPGGNSLVDVSNENPNLIPTVANIWTGVTPESKTCQIAFVSQQDLFKLVVGSQFHFEGESFKVSSKDHHYVSFVIMGEKLNGPQRTQFYGDYNSEALDLHYKRTFNHISYDGRLKLSVEPSSKRPHIFISDSGFKEKFECASLQSEDQKVQKKMLGSKLEKKMRFFSPDIKSTAAEK